MNSREKVSIIFKFPTHFESIFEKYFLIILWIIFDTKLFVVCVKDFKICRNRLMSSLQQNYLIINFIKRMKNSKDHVSRTIVFTLPPDAKVNPH